MWSLERYIIGKECELRLALTGTISKTTPVVTALRRGLLLGELPPMPPDIEVDSTGKAFLHILNTRRKSDHGVPVCTRVYWDEHGIADGNAQLRVVIDFATVKDDTAEFFYVTCKRMGGTPAIVLAYSVIGASLKHLYPEINKVYVRELLLLPMSYTTKEGSINRYEVILSPKQCVDYGEDAVNDALSGIFKLMNTYSSRSDLRKCRVSTDPCPAYSICQASENK